MPSRPMIFYEKRGHCHGLSFDLIFLKFEIWEVLLITRFRIISQYSTSLNLGQNHGWKKHVKIGSDVNLETKCRFRMILTCRSWICAYWVKLIKNERLIVILYIELSNKRRKDTHWRVSIKWQNLFWHISVHVVLNFTKMMVKLFLISGKSEARVLEKGWS